MLPLPPLIVSSSLSVAILGNAFALITTEPLHRPSVEPQTMGAVNAVPVSAKVKVRPPNILRHWTLEKSMELNHLFRASGAGFLLNVEHLARLLQVEIEEADIVCRALSRSPKKNSVNVMTVLAVTYFQC